MYKLDYICNREREVNEMSESQNKISEAEWQVMRVVWAKEKATSQEIVSVLSDTMDWKPATIKTLIGRLVKKEMISTEEQGNKYIYRALVTEETTIRSATSDLFSRICARKIGTTIGDLIAEAKLTVSDIEQIQKELNQKKPVPEIKCNCIPGQCECAEHK